MKRNDLKRKGAAVVAAALAAGMIIPSMALAAGPSVKVGSDSGVQMSSDPEAVYVNNYTGKTRSENFSDNWKFYMGDASGAENPGFDDSGWAQVNLPHDYSIEQEYSQSMEAESGYLPGGTGWYRKSFTLDESAAGKQVRIDFGGVYMNSTVWVNGNLAGTHPYGYTPFSFDITEYVDFGGENVITVKVDHQTPSSRWYSGSGIYRNVDLTITAPVHVDLYGTKIETPGLAENQKEVATNISTTVVNDSDQDQSVTLKHTVFPKDGDVKDAIGTFSADAQNVPAGSSAEISASGTVNNPTLWDTSDNPALYTVRTEVQIDGQTVDTYDTEYGFRYFEFDPDTGFSLNGENMKLKGVCMHHDQGALGAEAWESAIERQVRILKEMGCNSIRVTHNPASDELIEACNEQGILVIDEAFDGWAWPKNGNTYDYSRFFNQTIGAENQILGGAENMTWAQFDLTAMIKRGQNAPSVIMWSLGNEVQEGAGSLNQQYANIQANLITWVEEVDSTRPVTRGCNAIKGQTTGIAAEMMDSLSEAGGIAGFNYNSGDQYDTQHTANGDWIIYGSETASSINSRGVYDRLGNGDSQTPADQKLTSYDNSRVGWGALASSAWYEVIKRDFVAGEYVWTGFDYIGEPTPWNGTETGVKGTWPSPKNSYFGIIDTAGLPKDSYYFYQSQWNDDVNTLHILPAWNADVVEENENGKVPVVVYTDAAKVRLTLTTADGEVKDLGTKAFETVKTDAGYSYQIYKGQDAESTEHKNLYLTWYVPYEDGKITAEAWDAEGHEIDLSTVEGRTSVETTGEEAKLDASADREEIAADGADLAYITVDITDKDGNIVPDADNNVKFTVEGDGKLIGVDNGKQDDHQSYQDNNRDAFSGSLVAIVQSTKTAGEFTVTASADRLESAAVTVKTVPVDAGTGDTVLSYYLMSRNYYVKAGNMPKLPDTVKAVYSDGTEEDVTVGWDKISEDQTAQTGTFFVTGVTEKGDKVSVTVNMIDQVAALLNYSTTVPVGQEPTLPETRPAVLQNGDVISASFPVTWGEPDGSYTEPGTVKLTGTANVLGQELTVTASVRVQEQQVTIGDNVAGAAYLSQDIPEGQQSDTLDAIKDGNTEISDNTSGGANPTAWSNWTSSTKHNDNDAEITFRYDTQQRIGQITVYFARDNSSMTFPDEGTTEIYISETGGEGSWTKLNAVETIAENESSSRVKPYTYTFDPATATYVKLYVKNAESREGGGTPCTGITEVVINEWTGSYTINSGADFTSMTVNDLPVSAADLEAGVFNTEAVVIGSLEYETSENAAVTELPVYEGQKVLIIESEDHSERNTFTVNLGADVSAGDNDAADGSRDYDYTKTRASAGSVHPGSGNEGPASNAVDNNLGTWWHTNWQTLPPKEDLWITLELEEETMLDALRYYGRDGSPNGRVNEYKVEVSTDGKTWTTVSTGNWENTAGWKLAVFNEPAAAKYVRLTGVQTYGDSGNDKFMSAAEIRLRLAAELTDISSATVRVPGLKEVAVADEEHPVTLTEEEITVMLGETELRYGIDYIVSYENNTAEGTATAIVTGLGQYGYTGSAEAEFTIKVTEPAEPELTGIQITTPCKKNYTEGETLDPTGLVLELIYNNDTTEKVTYSDETAADFTFTPALGTALTTDMTDVTVEYAGKTTTFDITVSEKQQVIPPTQAEIDAAMAEADQIMAQTDKYTEESLEAYSARVAELKAILEDDNASAAEKVQAMKDLEAAKELLRLAGGSGSGDDQQNPGGGSTAGGSQTGSSGGSQTGSGDKAVQTGDTSNAALWAAAAALAGAALVTAGKKRRTEK